MPTDLLVLPDAVHDAKVLAACEQVIKGPITKHLPVGAARIGLSRTAEETVRLPDFYKSVSFEPTAVFVVGAMAHGHLDITYVDK